MRDEPTTSPYRIVVKEPGAPDRYVLFDDGFYSLWDDPARASSWDEAWAAQDVIRRAPPLIQFAGRVESLPEPPL